MNRTSKLLFLSFSAIFLISEFIFEIYSRHHEPHFPKYRFLIHEIYHDLNAEVSELGKKAIHYPQAPLTFSQLAYLQVSQARETGNPSFYQSAELNAQRSLKLLPQFNVQALLVLARVAEAKHDFDKAISLAEKATKSKLKVEAISILVTSHLAKGNLKEASFWADELVGERPGVGTYPLRALVLEAQGRTDEAESDFNRALGVEDIDEQFQSSWARALLARFYLKNRKPQYAEELLHESLRIYPKYPLALDLLGEVEIQRKNYKKAADNFFEAFLQSQQVSYLRHYALAKEFAGETKVALEARLEAEKLIRDQLKSGDLGHRNELALLLLHKSTQESAQEALALVQAEMINRKTAQQYHLLAKSLMKLNQWSQAQNAIRTALRTGIRDSEIYLDASRIEGQLGSKQRMELFERLSRS